MELCRAGAYDHACLQNNFMQGPGKPITLPTNGHAWIRGPLLGEGSYGRVYRATLLSPESPVIAIKTDEFSLPGTLHHEWRMLTRFKDCPNVIKCLGYNTTLDQNGQLVSNLLLEYASGGSLHDKIRESGSQGLPETEVRAHTRSILRGLDHIHRHGYVHCDMKPDNVLLVADSTNGFTAKISDFGVSKEKGTVPYSNGPRKYLSPEAELFGKQEAPADIWALGCVVLEMLVGPMHWHSALSRGEVLARIGVGRECGKISEDAKDFVMCCFEECPNDRQSAESLLLQPFVDNFAEVWKGFSNDKSSVIRISSEDFSFHFDFDD